MSIGEIAAALEILGVRRYDLFDAALDRDGDGLERLVLLRRRRHGERASGGAGATETVEERIEARHGL